MKRIALITILALLACFLTPWAVKCQLRQAAAPGWTANKPDELLPGVASTLLDFCAEPSRLRTSGRDPERSPRVLITNAPGVSGQALRLETQFPGEVSLRQAGVFDWSPYERLELEVYLPAQAGRQISVALTLDNGVWGRFRSAPTQMLIPGQWNRLTWNIANESPGWVAEEHYRTWDGYIPRGLREISLRFFSDSQHQGHIYLGPLQGVRRDRRLPLAIVELREESLKVGHCEKFEVAFDLTRAFANPFDPDEIDVRAEFLTPAGKRIEVFGYFDNAFVRRLRRDDTEELTPVGKGHWRARFAPRETGTYRYRLRAFAAGEETQTDYREFECVAAASPDEEAKGFIRWDRSDPRYTAWDNGEFLYPIGHTLRTPWDRREAYDYEFKIKEGRGTYAYDAYYDQMAESGENFARIWMAAWWTALEWTPGYDSSYPGLGRYNLSNAWRMDHIMDAAQQRDITIRLCLQNHGQFQDRGHDPEWYDNPYDIDHGGPLARPEHYFTDPEAKELFKKRLRYVVARWGHHSHLHSWELWNEVNLTSNYDSIAIRRWHQEMARYLRDIDPYNHIITTHYAGSTGDDAVYTVDEIEFSSANTYSANVPEEIVKFWVDKAPYGKPTLVNEYGIGKNAMSLELNLHGGIWGSYVTPFCQLGTFWWWHFVHQRDLYFHYRALADFHQGEDFRGQHFEQAMFEVKSVSTPVTAMGMQNDRRAYVWMYDPRAYVQGAISSRPLPIAGAEIEIDQLIPGHYEYIFWDTWAGVELSRGDLELTEGALRLPAPEFSRDCALKVRLRDDKREDVARK
ncbi:DUF5060 domain-containing protein [Candidatus Sumerlaeota bacterium]